VGVKKAKSPDSSAPGDTDSLRDADSSNRKKKGKEKQTLFTLGTFRCDGVHHVIEETQIIRNHTDCYICSARIIEFLVILDMIWCHNTCKKIIIIIFTTDQGIVATTLSDLDAWE